MGLEIAPANQQLTAPVAGGVQLNAARKFRATKAALTIP
jgi:hypothetical protein